MSRGGISVDHYHVLVIRHCGIPLRYKILEIGLETGPTLSYNHFIDISILLRTLFIRIENGI